MRNLVLAIIVFCIAFLPSVSSSQRYKIFWGDETKMKKSTVDMKLVAADKTGAYFVEGQLGLKGYYVIMATMKTTYKLVKFDQFFNQVYEKDYKKDMKGLNFNSIQPLKDKLFLFADDYNKKENLYNVYGVEVDKSSGELLGDFIELASVTLDSDKDDVDYICKPSQDSGKWQLVVNISPNDKSASTISVYSFDNRLKKLKNASIVLPDDPDFFSFEDLVVTNAGEYFLLGKEYENLTPEKKKKKLVPKRYVLRRYDSKGKKTAEFPLDNGNDKYSIGGKLLTLPTGKVIFAGFYSNSSNKRSKELNGIYTATIDETADKLVLNSSLEVKQDMLSAATDSAGLQFDEEGEEIKKSKDKGKKEDGDEGFSSEYVIRGIYPGAEPNAVVMVAEVYHFDFRTYTHFESTGGTNSFTRMRTEYEYRFNNRDIMVINATNDGRLNNLKLIAKNQNEYIHTSSSGSTGISVHHNTAGYFANGGAYPYYSSLAVIRWKDNLVLFYNDDERNANIVGTETKGLKSVRNFSKTSLYATSINLRTGDVQKQAVYANNEELIAMPRFSYIAGNKIYLPASKLRSLAKTKMQMGVITMN